MNNNAPYISAITADALQQQALQFEAIVSGLQSLTLWVSSQPTWLHKRKRRTSPPKSSVVPSIPPQSPVVERILCWFWWRSLPPHQLAHPTTAKALLSTHVPRRLLEKLRQFSVPLRKSPPPRLLHFENVHPCSYSLTYSKRFQENQGKFIQGIVVSTSYWRSVSFPLLYFWLQDALYVHVNTMWGLFKPDDVPAPPDESLLKEFYSR